MQFWNYDLIIRQPQEGSGGNIPKQIQEDKTMDLVKTGAFLKELRKEKNITQEELAERMGVSRRTVFKVSEYENEGKKRNAVVVIVYSALGIIALFANLIINMMEMPDSFLTGMLKGGTFALALGAMVIGIIYASGVLAKLYMFKKRLFEKNR